MAESRIGAVILASPDTGFAASSQLGEQNPCLVELGGVPIAKRVVEAAAACRTLSPIVVVGGDDSPSAPFGAGVGVPTFGSPVQDIIAGLSRCAERGRVLLLPGNLPFITSEEISLLLESADQAADITYPLVPRDLCRQVFPEFRPTGFRLAEGEVALGNALIVARARFIERPELLERLMQLRREPWRMARMVNPLVLLAFNAGRLTLEGLTQAIGSALGICVSVIILDAPGIAVPVQRPIDVRRARERLTEANQA